MSKRKSNLDTLAEIVHATHKRYGFTYATSAHLVWWILSRQRADRRIHFDNVTTEIRSMENNFSKFEAWAEAYYAKFGTYPISEQIAFAESLGPLGGRPEAIIFN